MRRLGILLSGRGSNFEAIADRIASGQLDAEIAVVIANRPEARGLEIARTRGLNSVCLPSKGKDREIYDREVVAELRKNDAELIILAGFMRVLSAYFIREYPEKIFYSMELRSPAAPSILWMKAWTPDPSFCRPRSKS